MLSLIRIYSSYGLVAEYYQ